MDWLVSIKNEDGDTIGRFICRCPEELLQVKINTVITVNYPDVWEPYTTEIRVFNYEEEIEVEDFLLCF